MIDCSTEEWRPVFDGTYEVSSLGRFRRAKPGMTTAKVGHVLSQSTNKRSGYVFVGLRFRGRKKTFLSHILVAVAFVGPCPEGHEVNHIDRTRTNNVATNLEYLTHSANLIHSSAEIARAAGKVTESDVLVIRARVAAGESQTAVAAEYGLHKTNVSLMVRRRIWRHVA